MSRRVLIGLVMILTVSMAFFCKPRTSQPPAVSQTDLMPVADLTPLENDEAKKSLLDHTKRLLDATVSLNPEVMTDLTHPAQVQLRGGRAAVIAHLKKRAGEGAADGWRITSANVGEPSEISRANGRLYAVVPAQSMVVSDQGEQFVNMTHLLGVSADGGRTWRFLTFSEGQVTREQIKVFVPDLPDSVVLPKAPQPFQLDPGDQ